MTPEAFKTFKTFLTTQTAWPIVNEYYDRSWIVSYDEVAGKAILTLETKVSDGDVWTVSDVAIYTHQTRDKVLRWCETRARHQARREGRIPIPFKKLDSKTLLFDRGEVIDWWSKAEPTALTPMKGKQRRK
jgi:hypothetical protein